MNEKGFTLLEVMIALLLFAILGLVPVGMLAQARGNRISELRAGAIQAAQQRLDFLRLQDISELPTSGSDTNTIASGTRNYELITRYCSDNSKCTTINTRHLQVEVLYSGQTAYAVETVFTQLR